MHDAYDSHPYPELVSSCAVIGLEAGEEVEWELLNRAELHLRRKRHAEHLWLDSDRYHSSENYDTYEWF